MICMYEMSVQLNQTNLTMRKAISARSMIMMTLTIQLGLVTTLAASSIRFWFFLSASLLC